MAKAKKGKRQWTAEEKRAFKERMEKARAARGAKPAAASAPTEDKSKTPAPAPAEDDSWTIL